MILCTVYVQAVNSLDVDLCFEGREEIKFLFVPLSYFSDVKWTRVTGVDRFSRLAVLGVFWNVFDLLTCAKSASLVRNANQSLPFFYTFYTVYNFILFEFYVR